jgi:hypothetical protein
MTTAAVDDTDEPRTGALEWAGQAAAAAPPPNDNAVTASAPMGNQVRRETLGSRLTQSDEMKMLIGLCTTTIRARA